MEKGQWLFSESQKGELFYIDSIDSYLDLDDVYEKVDWSTVENKIVR